MRDSMPSTSCTKQSMLRTLLRTGCGRMLSPITPSIEPSACSMAARSPTTSSSTLLLCCAFCCNPSGESTASKRPPLMMATR
ncbi:MAG: ST-I family heat-stable enterotoxin [Betaproteobacteria bacterium]